MADRKVFHDSITPLPAQGGLMPQGLLVGSAKPEHLNEKMDLAFFLGWPSDQQKAVERRIERGEVLKPDELPKAPDATKLMTWLKGEGFAPTLSKTKTTVYAEGSASQVQKSLETRMVRVTKDGLTYTAAQDAPSLPSDVGEPVRAIVGLQPFRHLHKHFKARMPKDDNRVHFGAVDASAVTKNVANAPPYLVPEILRAYGGEGIGVTGAGQTIAILIDTVPNMTDVRAFWSKNGITGDPARVEKVNVKGGHLPAPSGEETLDVEWSSGIAPGAKVRVYASGSLQFTDLDRALDAIVAAAEGDPSLRQVSISLGLGETYFTGATGEIDAQHQRFVHLAALGVNVFVATGDAGSNPDQSGHASDGPLQVEYESSDSCVVAVGGTTLKLAADGTVEREEAWASGGGGKSVHFTRPAWQTGDGVDPGPMRLVPDVSLAADPNEGAFLILHEKVVQIGGTSWSAPVRAAFCALLNEARGKAGKPPLPFLNPLLYPLAASGAFRDVIQGSNGAYDARAGYDLCTGIGVPNLAALARALA